jgi:protein-disulfide isomerase
VRVWIATVLRIALAAVWAVVAVGRLGDPAASVRAVRAYQLLPDVLERGVGYGLPFLALALALLLLLGLATRVAAVVSAAVFVLFLVALSSVVARGLRIGCGCFGGGGTVPAGQSTGYPVEIVVGVVLLLAAVALVLWPATRFALDDRIRGWAAAALPEVRTGPRRTAEARRRQAELARARDARAQRRVTRAGVLAGVLLVLVTGAGIGVQVARVSGDDGPSPQAVSVADGVQFGRDGARVTIEVYEDTQCKVCVTFEQQTDPQLQSWMKSSTARVKYYVVAFQDSGSTTKYSSRGAAALYCAADAGVFQQYHSLVFGQQPTAAGLSDDQLVALGPQAGIPAGAAQNTFSDCVTSKKYADFVSKISDSADQGGILAVPTVLVDGHPVSDVSLAGVTAAVDSAL